MKCNYYKFIAHDLHLHRHLFTNFHLEIFIVQARIKQEVSLSLNFDYIARFVSYDVFIEIAELHVQLEDPSITSPYVIIVAF